MRKFGLIIIPSFVMLVVALAITVFLINLHDQALLPEVAAALAPRAESIAARDNLFFAVLAFDVRESADINADGQRIYANYLRALQTQPFAPQTLAQDPEFPRLQFAGERQDLCGRAMQQDECLERAHSDARLQALVADNSLLLQRYESLQNYRHFDDILRPPHDSPVITWTSFLQAKALFLTSVAIDCARDRMDSCVARLQSDAAFTRRMLAEPELLLLDKMMLTTAFRQDLLLAAAVLRHEPLNESQYAALCALAAPMTRSERSLANAERREVQRLADALARFKEGEALDHKDKANQYLFATNATLNDFWRTQQATLAKSEASCHEVAAPVPSPFSYFYNPVGKILLRIGQRGSGLFQPVGIMCDLEAMQRIVALQVAIHSQHLTGGDIGAFVAHAGAELTDPYTGAPFH
ncbi:MAG TPA: hypothetical protein VGH84_08500, partial [Steroidobacteraceae bacterium]